MHLNHLNLTVEDVKKTTAFFEKYFEFTCTEKKGDNMLAVLYGKDQFILTLMSKVFNKNSMHDYPGAFHFGFILSSAAAVTALYERLKEDDVVIEKEPAPIRNSFGFYFHHDKLLIEIGYYFT